MPLSIPNPSFLVDENVNSRLFKFLKSQHIDVKLAPTASTDKEIAQICLKDNRILITNDEDFLEYSAEDIYSVVWLKTPQNKPDILVKSFEKLLSECKNFSGKVIILSESDWQDLPL